METPLSAPITGFEAFHKAQSEFKTALKDAKNPFFKSTYAPLASIYDAVSSALHANGLFVTQPVQITDSGAAIVETIVRYKDGTEIERSQCPVICKQANDPQAMGSAITYARRYSLASILCVITDDDDGEAAVGDRSAVGNKSSQIDRSANHSSVTDLTDWQTAVDACRDAADLNRLKKDIAAAKLGDDDFKRVWGKLSSRGKALGATYSTTAKVFSQP